MSRFRVAQTPKCTRCTQSVYPMEQIQYDGATFHQECFKCLECKRRLPLGNVAMINGQLYCKNCFKRIFRSRGKYSDFESGAEGGAGRLTPSPSLGDVKQEAAPAAEVQKKPAKIACAKGEDPKVSVLRPDGTVSGVTRVVLPDAQEELRINGGRHAFRSTPEVTGVQQGDEADTLVWNGRVFKLVQEEQREVVSSEEVAQEAQDDFLPPAQDPPALEVAADAGAEAAQEEEEEESAGEKDAADEEAEAVVAEVC